MKILVTGATGYVGNNLAHQLAEMGNEVHALVRSSSAQETLKHPNITISRGDILDKESVSAALKGCQQVYHTAGFVKLWAKNPEIFYKQNVDGTKNVLEAAREEGVKKFVYTSTCGVWGCCKDQPLIENDPRTTSFDNDYDLSKYLAELSVKEYYNKGLHTVIVNPPRIYGPGLQRHSSGVNRLILHLLRNRISTMPWRLETSANYAFIDDVVRGHILAMEKGSGGEKYILGGENVSYKRFLDTFKAISRTRHLLIRIPPLLLNIFGHLELLRGKINGHDPMITPNAAKRLQADKTLDCQKAIRQLGYSITPFEEGMKITIDHLKNHKS